MDWAGGRLEYKGNLHMHCEFKQNHWSDFAQYIDQFFGRKYSFFSMPRLRMYLFVRSNAVAGLYRPEKKLNQLALNNKLRLRVNKL